jgi:NAD(P)-dependent dehydrogenase (short-subunit alcohol dehydrogenase family)
MSEGDDMSTRIAIVAGAGSGLGQATALALHAAGYTVVAVDRSESGLNELPDAITHREVADATDPAVPVPLVDKIATEVGAPSVLVNTIGAFELSDALSTTPGYAAYGVSKAALAHLIRILDLELRPKGIRINAVAPQVIATAKNKAMFPPEALAGAVEPEAIANVIAFLVSDAAAPISGAIVPTYG